MARVFEAVGGEIYSLRMVRGDSELTLLVVADTFVEGERLLTEASRHHKTLGWKGTDVEHVTKVQTFLNGNILKV